MQHVEITLLLVRYFSLEAKHKKQTSDTKHVLSDVNCLWDAIEVLSWQYNQYKLHSVVKSTVDALGHTILSIELAKRHIRGTRVNYESGKWSLNLQTKKELLDDLKEQGCTIYCLLIIIAVLVSATLVFSFISEWPITALFECYCVFSWIKVFMWSNKRQVIFNN